MLQLFTASIAYSAAMRLLGQLGSSRGSMIEINDTRLTHYRLRIKRARKAAEGASSDAARQLHLTIAEMYEREIQTLLSRALPPA